MPCSVYCTENMHNPTGGAEGGGVGRCRHLWPRVELQGAAWRGGNITLLAVDAAGGK